MDANAQKTDRDFNREMVLYVDYIGSDDWGVWPRRTDAQMPTSSDKPKWRGRDILMLLASAEKELDALHIPYTIYWSAAAELITANAFKLD